MRTGQMSSLCWFKNVLVLARPHWQHTHKRTHSVTGCTSTYCVYFYFPPICNLLDFLIVGFVHYSLSCVALPRLLLSHITHPVPRPAIVSGRIAKQWKHFDAVIADSKVSSDTLKCQISSALFFFFASQACKGMTCVCPPEGRIVQENI